MRKLLIAASILCLTLAAVAQQPIAATTPQPVKAPPPPPTPTKLDAAIAGKIVRGDYFNQALGFQLKHVDGWETMNRGQMNLNEAVGRAALGQRAGVHNSRFRVFGMHDGFGSSVYVTIVPIPMDKPAPSLADVRTGLEKVAREELPNPTISEETALLSSASHACAAIRAEYELQERPMAQSTQVFLVDGYVLTFTVTSNSGEQLGALLADLKKQLSWQ